MIRNAILEAVRRQVQQPGIVSTPFDGVELFRTVKPVKRGPGVYSPCACIILSGEKHAYLGETRHVYDQEQYLCATMPTPVLAEVPSASEENPVLGVMVRVDTNVMSRLVLDMQAAFGVQGEAAPSSIGFGIAKRDEDFDLALLRLLELMDDPMAAAVLGGGRLREVMFAMLRGEAGERLRRDFGGAPALAATLAHVHEHLVESFSIDDLAKRAGMSRAVFDRQFRSATSLSPLQYIKALRLNEASMRIARGEGVGDAARNVGYQNSSQFSREFRRKFGASPRQWAQATFAQ